MKKTKSLTEEMSEGTSRIGAMLARPEKSLEEIADEVLDAALRAKLNVHWEVLHLPSGEMLRCPLCASAVFDVLAHTAWHLESER